MPLEKVILAEGDENLRRTVAEFIRSKRIDVAEAGTIQDVYNYLGKDEFDLIFIDAKLPECKLLDFFGDLNQRAEKPLLIPLVNGEPDSFVLDCFKAGALTIWPSPSLASKSRSHCTRPAISTISPGPMPPWWKARWMMRTGKSWGEAT